MTADQSEDDLGVVHSWGSGPEVVFLSNPLADPVNWSAVVRDELLELGCRVTTFEHRPDRLDWGSAVGCVVEFLGRRRAPVALVGWSQGAAIAQEVALASPEAVTCAALLATYGRQNEIDKTLQQSWDRLAQGDDDLDSLRLAMALLTAYPPQRLADDNFVAHMRARQVDWAGRPDPQKRRRAGTFIATYQDRLPALAAVTTPCLVMGFELDTDTFAARAREVAQAIPRARYVELDGIAHAAPFTDPQRVWPPVIDFLRRHHRPR
ncbi:MAG: alpha/beta hydrolase [Kutzneria sp.]|nr:alpha/beta hydrolase [Kutzneria sp.]